MAAIVWDSIAVGMEVTATTTQAGTGAFTASTATVTSVDQWAMHLSNGTIVPRTPADGTTLALDKVADAPVTIPAEPSNGTIVTDETGAAWQALADSTTGQSVWYSINGDRLAWADFYTAHPTYTTMQDTAVVPLPAPVAPYPTVIAPGDARLGMDVRVTVTYDAGGSKVVRGVCPWVQQNPPPDDTLPSFLFMPNIGGAQIVADLGVLATFDQQSVADQSAGRYVVQYDPLPAGITLLVEQMQDWTADSVWDISGTPEPPTGSIVRSKTGIAWQRTGDATQDGDWYKTGDGLWSSVTGDYPRSFLWLWGAAAPFVTQEATP